MASNRKDSNGRVLPENVIQRKDGTYMWKKSIRGVQYCEYARTLGEIKQKRNKALGEIEAGTYEGKLEKIRKAKVIAEKDITLNEWFVQWEKTYRVGIVKDSTLEREHYDYMRHFSDTIGKLKMKGIMQIDIVQVLNDMYKSGIKVVTIKRYYGSLFGIFKSAVNNGLIESNPVEGAFQLPDEKVREKKVLSEAEEEQFFDFIRRHYQFWKYINLYTLGFGTGMRIGEILALTWEDIDFENSVIHVNKTLTQLCHAVNPNKKTKMKLLVTSPKTPSSIRDIPMIPKVRAALLDEKKNGRKSTVAIDGYKNFVFVSNTGTRPYRSTINNSILDIVNAMNEEEKQRAKDEKREPVLFDRFSAHCMRHTFATRCYEKGVSPKVAQKILGHKNPDMTLNVYTHLTDDMIQRDLDKLN